MDAGAKAVSASRLVLAQVMTPQDANIAGNVHGGNIMKLADTASAVVAIRHSGCICVTASMPRTCYFTMVALDAGGHPTAVPRLFLETEEDRRRNAEAALRVESRRMRSEGGTPPC